MTGADPFTSEGLERQELLFVKWYICPTSTYLPPEVRTFA